MKASTQELGVRQGISWIFSSPIRTSSLLRRLFGLGAGRVKVEAAKSIHAATGMKPIKGAGHEAGDFFFVPKGLGKT